MFKTLLYKLPANVSALYRGYNLLWQLIAVAVTALLVLSGADWTFFEATRSDLFTPFIYAAGIGGFFVPVLATFGLYIYGDVCKNLRLKLAGAAIGQASLIGWCLSSFYKIFTGRIQPEFLTTFNTTDISREFHFGFLQNGIFWGWPSSHAAVAWAGAIALAYIYRTNKVVGALAVLYALFISFGAAVGFHWLSDVVVGTIIGVLAGLAVGKAFQSSLAKTG